MIEDIIRERDKTHGDWSRQSQLSHDLKRRIAQEQPDLTASQWEAIEMIQVKIARIVCGDPFHKDSWLDVAGYATLGGSE
jgi:hypothetical protein